MSPLQGAMIAAAIANEGVVMEPYVVDTIYSREGAQLYQAEQKIATQAVDPATAAEIRRLMRATVQSGTGRHSFRGFFKREYAGLDVGGKTGSLTGDDPKGKYDWFVGYAQVPGTNRKIAVAALTVHRKLWRVKSAYLARRAFETMFKAPSTRK
jgi:cell division protein FtsI/penicillin-binding protein 2